jgi:hypothetical protein
VQSPTAGYTATFTHCLAKIVAGKKAQQRRRVQPIPKTKGTAKPHISHSSFIIRK